MIKVFVCEEYGYRNWIWYFNGTVDELIAWWVGLQSVSAFFVEARKVGRIVELRASRTTRTEKTCAAHVHVHEEFDSSLHVAADNSFHLHAGHRSIDDVEIPPIE
jgi:hypothetical protein